METIIYLTRITLMMLMLFINDRCSADQFTASSRAERFLFSFVRFKNSMCKGDNGLSGTCYTKRHCLVNSGKDSGPCADGFGSCCTTRLGCGGRTSNNCTYIESPNYPNVFNGAKTCVQSITLDPHACQVRLDVTEVNLTPPNQMGNCVNDVLTFSQDIKWTQVCGITQNTNFYLEVDPAVKSTLDFTFKTDNTNYNRRWRIKVCQICCDQLSMAPMGCGQYFTSKSGTLTAWNAQGNPNYYLSGQNYAICMRKELNMCSTTYSTVNNQPLFIPTCDDTLEWPTTLVPVNNIRAGVPCNDPAAAIIPIQIGSTTVPLQGPAYAYFVTTDTGNDHDLPASKNLYMNFEQNPC